MSGTRHSSGRLIHFILLVVLLGSTLLFAQDNLESPADAQLARARKAIEDKDYVAAVREFREFVTRYGQHKDADASRLALAQALLEKPNENYAAAFELLNVLAAKKDQELYPSVLFYQGVAQRGQGLRELAQAAAKPAVAGGQRTQAAQYFANAGKHFAAAAGAFSARVKEAPKDDAPLPADLEWSACACVAQAEMLLRGDKLKEVQTASALFLKDSRLARSRFRDQALYYNGLASYLLSEHHNAGRSLNLMSSFGDPAFGNHARYLLARIHEHEQERAEARAHYEGIVGDYETRKAQAAEVLKQPEKLQDKPTELARLQELVKAPLPEHVLRSSFHLGVLYYEAGRFVDAQACLTPVADPPGRSTFRSEAQLLLGMCAVRLEQYPDATRLLQDVATRENSLAAIALLWLGKTQAASADPEDPPTYQAALQKAQQTLRKAIDACPPLPTTDAQQIALLQKRRGEILLELADIHHRSGQHKDAAGLFKEILEDNLLPHRVEEIRQRQVSALNLAGIYAEALRASVDFQKDYPKSVLLAEVLFRRGETASFLAANAESNARVPGPGQEAAQKEVDRLNDEAARHYQTVIDKIPEATQVSPARLGLALTYYRKGDLEKAAAMLEAVPPTDRGGDLALVPYVLADCLIRLAPTSADDAISAGKLTELMGKSTELLGNFVAEHPPHPLAADALLRIAVCQQRLAPLQAKPEDQKAFYSAARSSYERLLVEYPGNDLGPLAALERAKVLVPAGGDAHDALGRLRSFAAEPFGKQPIAPLAMLQLGTLLRGQENGAANAAQVLGRCRQQHEKAMLADPARASWVPLLQFHHAVALRESGKYVEARAILEGIPKQFPSHPLSVEAPLRWGQTVTEQAWKQIEKADQALATPEVKPDVVAAANQSKEEAHKLLAQALAYFENHAEQLKQKQPKSEVRARMLYEVAWGQRNLIDREVETARKMIQDESVKKLQAEAARTAVEGQPPPTIQPPDVPLDKIAIQSSEKKSRSAYQALIAAFPDSRLAGVARLELGEVYLGRGEIAAGLKIFNEGLDKEPPADLTNRLRLRLGMVQFLKGDFKAALPHFYSVTRIPDDPLAGQGHYRAAECLIRMDDTNKAIERLVLFRDNEKFQNVGNVSDLALLRLSQVLGQLKRWDESRQASENMLGRFGGSGWAREAWYASGYACHKQKQYDQASNAYRQAMANQADETAARAHFLLAACQLERQQYAEALASFLAVVEKYSVPEIKALALVDAAHAHVRLKQPAQAKALLERVVNDCAGSPWADLAKQRLKTPNDATLPHNLAAALKVLAPTLNDPPGLDDLGQYQDDRVSLDDPAGEIVWNLIMGRKPPDRQAPFPWQPQSLPEPFEHHHPIPVQRLVEERVQAPERLRLP